MASTSIDVASLHAALDAARTNQELSWRQLAGRLDLSPSTLSRLANGFTPDTAAFTSMVTWLNMPAESFIRSGEKSDDAAKMEPDLVAVLAPLLRARNDLEPEDVQHLEQLIGSAVQRFQNERTRRER